MDREGLRDGGRREATRAWPRSWTWTVWSADNPGPPSNLANTQRLHGRRTATDDENPPKTMSMQASGRLHAVFDTKQITERFQKREFVLEIAENPQYPQYVAFELTGDRVGEIEQFRVGDTLEVEFSLRGREWTSRQGEVRYFNSLDVRAIRGQGSGGGNAAPPPDDEPPPFTDDDVPF